MRRTSRWRALRTQSPTCSRRRLLQSRPRVRRRRTTIRQASCKPPTRPTERSRHPRRLHRNGPANGFIRANMAGFGCPMAGNMSMKARMGPIPHINTSIVWAWVGRGSQRPGCGAGAPILTSESGGHITSAGIEACIAPVMAGDITVEAIREAGIPPEDTGAAADIMRLARSVADTGAGPAPGRMAGLVCRAPAGRTVPRKFAARFLPAPEP